MMEDTIERVQHNRYNSYKVSELSGIDEIPKQWKWIRANYVFTEIKERSKTGKEELLSVSEHNGVKPRSESNVNMFKAESYKGYKLCYPGDLVINSLWAWSRGLGISEYEGIVSTAYSVFRPDYSRYNKVYLDYLLRSKPYVNQYFIKSKGIWISRLQLSDWAFLRIPILSPPQEEQNRIALFLDKKTAQIDRAIAQKERLIELLNERRQIVIQKTVTRGLNPDAPMKDSGVEWIGAIPEHWEVKKLKYEANVVLGKMLCTVNKGNYCLKPYLKSKNIQWLNVDISSVDEMWFSESEMEKYLLRKGDLVLSEGGEVGKSCIWNNELEECYIQNSAHKITVKQNNVPEYFLYLFFTFGKAGFFESIVNRVSIAHLTKDKLINVEVLVPPRKVQEDIAAYISMYSEKVDSIIELKESEIRKLKEYKTTLINSAVTGKIKV